ncbi:hypothetical protein E2C01_007938 [Portunus trituberculatus]|uniref:Uncharacterized protein n=1 Tax=Portunus trituberculatus TaxID=210409 RepID=A0A5B7D2K2_PORTR|nr:hypothetical protein [Portunus trituberculatus]
MLAWREVTARTGTSGPERTPRLAAGCGCYCPQIRQRVFRHERSLPSSALMDEAKCWRAPQVVFNASCSSVQLRGCLAGCLSCCKLVRAMKMWLEILELGREGS